MGDLPPWGEGDPLKTGERESSGQPGSGRAALLHPLADEPAEVPDEALVLVRRVGAAHGLEQQAVELGRGDPLEHELVDVAQPAVDEVEIAVDLEVLVGQLAVAGELLLVVEVLA